MVLKQRDSHVFPDSSRLYRAWYDADRQEIEVQFVDGVHWHFLECTVQTWQNFTKTFSPGRFIHEILNRHPHGPA